MRNGIVLNYKVNNMETMYIKKGCPIIIQADGYEQMRYFEHNMQEAMKDYRERNDIKYKHYKKVYVKPSVFGYL